MEMGLAVTVKIFMKILLTVTPVKTCLICMHVAYSEGKASLSMRVESRIFIEN